MINILRKEDCCGCTACFSVCPVNCIDMQEDFEGFSYPVVDKRRCIDCHKCENVCPVINNTNNKNKPKAYLARTTNPDVLKECTSGGVFSELARDVIAHGGIVYGAVYDDRFNVRHIRISNIVEMKTLPGSKYVQSNMGESLRCIKADLDSGLEVAFCGTPCQVAGVYNYLGKRYEKLLLVDLVCHGVPSPKLWRMYLEYIEGKYGKLVYANFRSKCLGYHVSVMEERFVNGKTVIGSARTNLMSKIFFKNVADRPLCYECPFKTVSRCSDLTLFDGWHAREYVDGLKDDDKGYTVVLVHSEKGDRVIHNQYLFDTYLADIDKTIKLDGKMAINSVVKPVVRNGFYKMLDENGLEKTVGILFPISRTDFFVEKIKVILSKMNLLRIVKLLFSW